MSCSTSTAARLRRCAPQRCFTSAPSTGLSSSASTLERRFSRTTTSKPSASSTAPSATGGRGSQRTRTRCARCCAICRRARSYVTRGTTTCALPPRTSRSSFHQCHRASSPSPFLRTRCVTRARQCSRECCRRRRPSSSGSTSRATIQGKSSSATRRNKRCSKRCPSARSPTAKLVIHTRLLVAPRHHWILLAVRSTGLKSGTPL
mmetsp:Transcript_55332/g.109873  ORF Transcript_55332/g.109873 Transcript_55332/m.109873 type:complete len:205 (-) Transcript_55332:19-633(-)